MLALIASVGGFIFGYDTGQISDMLLMDDFKLRFATCADSLDPDSCEFSDVRAGLIVSLLSIGTLVGALAGAEVADFLGRRWAIITESILFSVGLVIQMAAFTVWQQVAVGRFVAGVGVGALSAVVPMVSLTRLLTVRSLTNRLSVSSRNGPCTYSWHADSNLSALHHGRYSCCV